MTKKIRIIIISLLVFLSVAFSLSYLNANNTNLITIENSESISNEDSNETVSDEDLNKEDNINEEELTSENEEINPESEVVDEIEEVEKLPKTSKITISAAGDIISHIPFTKAHNNREIGGYDFTNPFKYIRQINQNTDLSIANLENPIRNDREPSGYPNFNAPYEVIYGARYGGFNVLATANNHSYDQVTQGVLDTIDRIKDAEIDYVGTNYTSEDNRYRLYDINNIKVGLICYTYGLNGYTAEEDYLVNVLNFDKISEDINSLRELGAEKIIFFVHWGTEYNTYITDDLRKYAHDVLDLGVDYILGAHPHVVMPIEVLDEKFIVYSMGNFVSNQRSEFLNNENVEDGLFVTFDIVKDLETNTINFENLNLEPTWVDRFYDDKWYYEIIPVNKALNNELEDFVLDERRTQELTNSKARVESILNR